MFGTSIKKLKFRYNKLSLWNKFGFWGSICSIFGLLLYLLSILISFNSNNEVKVRYYTSPDISSTSSLASNSNTNAVEIGELFLFFLKNSNEGAGHNWGYGTTGDLRFIQWSNNTIEDQTRLSSIKRQGKVYIKLGEKLVNPTEEGIPKPWNIELIGFNRTAYGFDEIHFESGSLINWNEDDFKYSLNKVGIQFQNEECFCCLLSVLIWTLSHEVFGKGILIINSSCGVAGCDVDLYFYPFMEKATCKGIFYNNWLIENMEASTKDEAPAKWPIRVLMGWTKGMDENMRGEIEFLEKYGPKKRKEGE